MSGKILADNAFAQWRPVTALLLLIVSLQRPCRRVQDGRAKSEKHLKAL